MLKIKPFKQKPSACGPASLKMVLGYYGLKKSEKELIKLSSCTKTKGTKASGLLKAASHFGFDGFIRDFSDIKDLKNYVVKKKIPVIVDWFSVDEGHYSVVVDINKKNIYLQDPEIGRIKSLSINKFKTAWFDFPSPYLKSNKDLIIRRMIVIKPRSHS